MPESQPSVERLWQATLEHSPVGMSLVSPTGEMLAANRALCAMLGYTEEQLKALSFQQFTHPDDLQADLDLFAETLAGRRTSYRMIKRYIRADGSIIWADLSVALLRDEDGTPLHFIGQISDVTRQHLDRQELTAALAVIDRQSRKAQAILDSVDVGLVLLDRDGHYEQMNRRHQDFMEQAFPDGHAGRAGQLGEVFAQDATTPLDRDGMPTIRAVGGEEFDDYRIWVGADPATRRALSVSARLVRDPDGAPAGAALAYKDITDLMRALRAQEDFVADVSHELRSPLTSVLGHLELLLESDRVPPELVRQLMVIQRNAERLLLLVSDLLATAGQREGLPVMARTSADLADLTREVVESVQPTADAAAVTIDVDLPDAVPACVDARRLRQVVDNLVSNAVKYTDAGGRVDVRLRALDGLAELTVADTGIGIAADDLEQLFEPFFRADEARRRVSPGVGLGLGIARSIVEAHGGRVAVSSEPGEGSRFVVTLPTTPAG
jgi:PAS domain S-box-containing protein